MIIKYSELQWFGGGGEFVIKVVQRKVKKIVWNVMSDNLKVVQNCEELAQDRNAYRQKLNPTKKTKNIWGNKKLQIEN